MKNVTPGGTVTRISYTDLLNEGAQKPTKPEIIVVDPRKTKIVPPALVKEESVKVEDNEKYLGADDPNENDEYVDPDVAPAKVATVSEYTASDDDEDTDPSSDEFPDIPSPPKSKVAFRAEFDDTLQPKILQLLIHDREWAGTMVGVLKPQLFDMESLRITASVLWGFFKKFGAFPSFSIFRSALLSHVESLDPASKEQVVRFINTHSTKPIEGDVAYVKSMVERWGMRQAYREAIHKSLVHLRKEDYGSIYQEMQRAVAGTASGSKGHNFHTDRKARWSGIERNPVPTGMPFIDSTINGGVSAGELAVILAATGVGKSHFLVNVGANAIMRGFNVVHYTFELDEFTTGRRYDSHISDISSNEVVMRRDEVEKIYEKLRDDGEGNGAPMGDLYIKEYATGTASVLTLKSNLERLAAAGFYPDLIIVDYADIMQSTGTSEGERFKQKAVYVELRALAKEFKVPVWTASQSNREGANTEIITTEHMGEAYGKAAVSDLVLSVSQKALEKNAGIARIFFAKNRLGYGGSVVEVHIDTARSKFVETGGVQTAMEAQGEDHKRRSDFGTELAKTLQLKRARALAATTFEDV